MLQKVRICLLILFLSSPLLPAPTESIEPVRGVWIVRHNLKNEKSIDSLLAFCQRQKFTDLFVQIRGRGDAYYQSNIEPSAEEVDPDFDPLAYLLKQARGYSFRIHGWVNMFYLWSKERLPKSDSHLLRTRPEWLGLPATALADSLGQDSTYRQLRNTEGLYNSPMIPEVQAYLHNIIMDILSRYPLDGIHFDYIRFPDENFDLHPVIRELFKKKYFIDPAEFKQDPEAFAQRYGPTGYDIFFSRWGEFLRNGLSHFVEQLTIDIRRNYPQIVISAAVKPELYAAHWRFYQEWDDWLKRGLLDYAVPMNYTPDNTLFLQRIEGYVDAADIRKVLVGIALYNQKAAQAVQKILAVEKLDLPGYVLFSYDQLAKDKQMSYLYRNRTQVGKKRP